MPERFEPEQGAYFYMRRLNIGVNLSGVTVSYGNLTNMSFHAHNELSVPSIPLPAEVEWMYGDRLIWSYFPVFTGEKICAVWVVTLPGGLASVVVRISRSPCLNGLY